MKAKTITLRSFEDRLGSDFELTCTISRCGDELFLAYALQGNLGLAAIPQPAKVAERRDRLWEDTCLECFIAGSASEVYWEFNLSPAGHWNVYHFDAYRMGMREEPSFSSLPIETHVEARILRLCCRIDLSAIGTNRRGIQMEPCAVIRSCDGQKSYWAPVHHASGPDFHRRDAFILQAAP